MSLLQTVVEGIEDLDGVKMSKAQKRIDALIKPVGSLGKLEDISVKLTGITGDMFPKIKNKAVLIFAGDHGVYEEGVAPNPQETTAVQTKNFARGLTGVCALAKQTGTKIIPVDVGVKSDINMDGVINRKIRYGTANMAKEPAMTREEAIRAVEVGIELTIKEIDNGVNLITTGEMGIGNTTPSAAIISVFGGFSPYDIAGKGAGLDEKGVLHKASVIKASIDLHDPNKDDALDVLSKVGGLEIGAMAGVMLACAYKRVPVVVDGFIATAAALLAYNINSKSKEYMIASHYSKEKGAMKASELLGLSPMLDMNMRLGEGSGGVLAFNLIEAATYMNNEMITFDEAGFTI